MNGKIDLVHSTNVFGFFFGFFKILINLGKYNLAKGWAGRIVGWANRRYQIRVHLVVSVNIENVDNYIGHTYNREL